MVIYTLAFLAGICCVQFFPQLPDSFWGGVVFLAALCCLTKTTLRPLAVFLFALLWAWWQAALVLSHRLPTGYAGKDLLVRGVIEDIPMTVSKDSYRFIFTVRQIQNTSTAGWVTVHWKSRLRWYRNAPALRAGENWQLRVRLKPPRGLANPGGFDYERWLFSQQFAATGYVRTATENHRLGSAVCRHINCWRQALAKQLSSTTGSNTTGLLVALAIGDRSGISQQQWDMLRNTGTAHLMAISGLHIGLVAGLLFAVSQRLWKLFRLAQFYPASRAAAVTAILGALAYAILGGFSLPTQRAVVMVTVFMSGFLLNRCVPPTQALCISLVVILLYDPLAVLSSGFWLSFGAVAWIFYIISGRQGASSKIRSALHIQGALTLGLLPVLLLGFQQVSLSAPLANMIAVPVVGLGVVPCVLTGTALLPVWPAAAGFLIQFAGQIMQLLAGFLDVLNSIPIGIWRTDSGGLAIAGLCLLSAALMLAPAGLSVRLAGLLLLAPLLLGRTPRPAAGEIWLDLLDAGQGLAAVVRTRRHVLVFDTGPRSRSGFDTGKAVVVPFLISEQISGIDKLVISHSDNDHQGGAQSIFNSIRVDSILSGMPGKIDFARSRLCQRGQSWEWDRVVFEILSPVARNHGNNASCVLKIMAENGQSVLLTGDIEASIEHELVNTYRAGLRASILVVPHHGSRTSSTAGFVDAIAPEVALIPAGYANRFGFPKADVVDRYTRRGATVYVTGTEGAIRVILGHMDQPPAISGFRQSDQHYWQSTPTD